MLSIGKMGGGQERYYLDKVAEGAEDYYSGEGEAEGYWLGDAAEDLGLQGKVDPDELIGMLTGINPDTGESLGPRHVEGGAVPGFDLAFSAPKSVSLTWALGGYPVAAEVKAAHASAVEVGLDYLSARRAGPGAVSSLLIDAGVNPKAIQEFMGHATIEETFSRYGHLMPGARDQGRELVDAYMAAAREAAYASAFPQLHRLGSASGYLRCHWLRSVSLAALICGIAPGGHRLLP